MMTKLVAMNRRDSNPCLSKGAQEVEIPFASKVEQMTGTGAFKECEELIDSVLGKDAGNCTCGLCTYGAKFQPQPIKEYVAFAFYMERTVDIGLTSPITLADLRRKGDEVCSMTKEAVNKAYPHIANGQGVDLCFDLAFIHSHLHKGHGIPEFDETIKIHVVSKIKGVELGWALGAMFDELSKLDEEAMQQ
ncbi:Guanosine-diphosphatase [Porphyridium purpureum]|nr:Guanosine-diphosphatase [Porphyridium purpureum]|eukprot:POR9836..scf261_15